ncbi:3'-5' exonuclease [Hahella sp. KA22]|uniref:3'-5' exonuclease n=1 Tax=Hahella sp. KA22 TaxID=1628392 RepID=UPI000FDE3FC5|nr:3'-5' exonuclease [Hahella sp. KA22]AZZ92781.1 3'-5' exonuclease [Hahella sp. KA22]QAY56155.1 3'-5' exonuclease [Hahella sp. KA22]
MKLLQHIDQKLCRITAYRNSTQATRRERCREIAGNWLAMDPLFLDTETTGLDQTAEVVEIAVTNRHGTKLLNTLVKPQGPMSAAAQNVHQISELELKGAPSWPITYPRVYKLLYKRPVIIFNADFDVRILRQTCNAWALPPIPFTPLCAMRLYAEFHGQWSEKGQFKYQSQARALEQIGHPAAATSLHRAAYDAQMTSEIIYTMATGIKPLRAA